MTAREEPIHTALTRPVLVFGAERELALVVGGFGVILALAGNFRPLPLGLALFLLFVVLPLLRVAAKHDASLSRVYVRHVRYQSYYPALAHPAAPTLPQLPFHRGLY